MPIRRSARLEGYDYSLAGAYFLTICTRNRICCLASIEDGRARTTEAGDVVKKILDSLPDRFSFVDVDASVVMPNHIHAIILLGEPDRTGKPNVPSQLGWIVRTLKAASTRLIRKASLENFAWQRDYYDHIVRNEPELQRIREYIEANPARWDEDPENTRRQSTERIRPFEWDV
jgi:REP element-mobilizing transposase RayT